MTVSEKDTSECLRLHEREREREHTVLPVAGQRWAVVVVEGEPGEGEGEEGVLACSGLRYLQKQTQSPSCSCTKVADQLLVILFFSPCIPEAATVLRGTFNDLLHSSLNRKSFHQRTAQNRIQQTLHPL